MLTNRNKIRGISFPVCYGGVACRSVAVDLQAKSFRFKKSIYNIFSKVSRSELFRTFAIIAACAIFYTSQVSYFLISWCHAWESESEWNFVTINGVRQVRKSNVSTIELSFFEKMFSRLSSTLSFIIHSPRNVSKIIMHRSSCRSRRFNAHVVYRLVGDPCLVCLRLSFAWKMDSFIISVLQNSLDA